MPRLSFTLRDVFWLTLVVGMSVGWWMEGRRGASIQSELNDLRPKHEKLRRDARIMLDALNAPREGGWAVWRIEGIEDTRFNRNNQ